MKWIALVTLVALSLVRLRSPVVRTTSGLIRGTISENGKFYQYFGIPYGTVNESNRFQAPMPPPTWEGIFEAVDEKNHCSQVLTLTPLILGQIDCLTLNIYVPITARQNSLLPVMFHIHGGHFATLTGGRLVFGGDNFPDYDVIYVGFNYRLSIEGFLCLGIKEAPGNAGLKDQVAALKWVQNNIKAFGGDPDNITIFGESAGAVSVSLMTLTPSARGLFHKIIVQGGSSLATWGYIYNPVEVAGNFVKIYGYDTRDPLEIYNIISKRTPYELIADLEELKANSSYDWIAITGKFRPCIEKQIEGVEPFITDHPLNIYASGNFTKVPVINGYTDKEGMIIVGDCRNFIDRRKNDWLVKLLIYQLLAACPRGKRDNVTVDGIQNFYTSMGNWTTMEQINFYSDMHLKFPMALESDILLKSSHHPVFRYYFKYNGLLNYLKIITGFKGWKGACHGDEIFYLFKPYVLPTPQRFLERKQIKRMLTLWTNFAKFSDPTPETSDLIPIKWQPSTDWIQNALIIDKDLSIGPSWDERSARFWNETYNEFCNKNI